MFKGIMNYLVIGVVAIFGFSSASFAGEEPIEMLVKFKIKGVPSIINQGAFTVGGPGYAAKTTSVGEILDTVSPTREVATLSGAEIAFIPDPNDPDQNPLNDYPVINFTCLTNSCKITFRDGSVLESVFDVPLSGRLVTGWGPVMNSDFVPGVSTPMRILGCGGLRETEGKGRFAGMVGSICFNGVFNLPGDPYSPTAVLTGGSNCTITMHTPVVPLPY